MTYGNKPITLQPRRSYYVDRHSGQEIWETTEYARIGTSKYWNGADFPGGGVESPLPVDPNGNIRWADFVRAAPKPPVAEHAYEMSVADENIDSCTFTLPADEYPSLASYVAVPSTSVHYQAYDPVPEMRISLASKLGEKISGSDWHAGCFVAEAPAALSMIAGTATTLAQLGRAVRRADVAGVVQALGTQSTRFRRGNTKRWAKHSVAGRWLELQYGWMPLLSDIKGGAEFLAHHFNVPQQRRVRVRTTHRGSYELLAGCTGGSERVRLQVVAVLREQPSVVQLAGLTDPATVVWNLVPFSFVADWVIPVGDWLAARNTISALGSNTVYVVTESHETQYSGRPYQPNLRVAVQGAYSYRRFSVKRTIEGAGTFLPHRPSVNRLDQIFSGWRRAANAVSLLQAVFGRK